MRRLVAMRCAGRAAGLHGAGGRWNATAAPTSSSATLARLLTQTKFLAVKGHLEGMARAHIERAEYWDVCAAHGLDKQDGNRLLGLLTDLGVVVAVTPNDELLHIKMGVVMEKLKGIVAPGHDNLEAQKTELDALQGELGKLHETKCRLDQHSRVWMNRMFGAATLILGVQMGVLSRLTFVDLDWDVMEPITYFITTSSAFACFGYSWWRDRDYTYDCLEEKWLSGKQRKAYEAQEFNYVRYRELLQRTKDLEQEIRRNSPPEEDEEEEKE